MPIYGYTCSACGFQKDYIQKINDDPITSCPQCQQETMVKQLSAPGFLLKGSGWAVSECGSGKRMAAASHKTETK